VGASALLSNTTASNNAAMGEGALLSNTTASNNAAMGYLALENNTTGIVNAAVGAWALQNNTTGVANAAVGSGALGNNINGSGNIALGSGSGINLTSGYNNIYIGNNGVATEIGAIHLGDPSTHTATYIAGINGVTVSSGVPVLINSSGQLGTILSSRRFKEEIRDMSDASSRLLRLRPVTFRYKPEYQKGERALQYGLIAEEVAEVFPDLVQYSETGQANTVYYHLLTPMLLNEFQKQHRTIAEQQEQMTKQQVQLVTQRKQIEELSTRQQQEIAGLKAQYEQVIANLAARVTRIEAQTKAQTAVSVSAIAVPSATLATAAH
jgi:hypothetical protein